MKKIAIIGATGYTGSELVRILTHHPEVSIEVITSETHKGMAFSDIHPQFRGIADDPLRSADEIENYSPDLVFLALPHGISMQFVEKLWNKNIKIIDLSGDFRLNSPDTYYQWYNIEHSFPEGFKHAIFGLPELNRDRIKNSHLVANPGCFPTGAILSVYPLLKHNLVNPEKIIIDSKTGVTGAGVKPKNVTHFPNVHDNFKAYNISGHRHTIEIQQELSKAGEQSAVVQFTPHLLPVDRGILSTAYTFPNQQLSDKEVKNIFKEMYKDTFFIRYNDALPEIKNVRATNYVDISVSYDQRTGNIISLTALDNLVKGAAGQAVQNMNLMLNLDELSGLNLIPVHP